MRTVAITLVSAAPGLSLSTSAGLTSGPESRTQGPRTHPRGSVLNAPHAIPTEATAGPIPSGHGDQRRLVGGACFSGVW